jgi:hypothetical protein
MYLFFGLQRACSIGDFLGLPLCTFASRLGQIVRQTISYANSLYRKVPARRSIAAIAEKSATRCTRGDHVDV